MKFHAVDKGESGISAGIYPMDPSVFKDEDLQAAAALNDPEK